MSPFVEDSIVGPLKRIDDGDAASLVSEHALIELGEAILAIPSPAPEGRPGRMGAPGVPWRPTLALTAAVTIAAIILAVAGVFAGSGPVAVPAASAAVLRGASRALAHPGTIVIESFRGTAHSSPSSPTHIARPIAFSARAIVDTPAGAGPQNYLNLSGIGDTDIHGVQSGEVNGNNELYDPQNDTIYITSRLGPEITNGPRPGTYVYTFPKGYPFPRGVAAPLPLRITAAQAHALRDGTADVLGPLPDAKDSTATHVEIVPLVRAPVQTDEIRAQLKAGRFTVSGATTIAGRHAIKLIGVADNPVAEYDVAPRTYSPIREVIRASHDVRIITYAEYRVLPSTPDNARLLSLVRRHPSARVDRRPADYLAAQTRLLAQR